MGVSLSFQFRIILAGYGLPSKERWENTLSASMRLLSCPITCMPSGDYLKMTTIIPVAGAVSNDMLVSAALEPKRDNRLPGRKNGRNPSGRGDFGSMPFVMKTIGNTTWIIFIIILLNTGMSRHRRNGLTALLQGVWKKVGILRTGEQQSRKI